MKDKWGDKYPNAIKSPEDNWDNLSTFFAFPGNIRNGPELMQIGI